MLLLFTDLDHMKWINDTLGHPEGDRALIETAQVLENTFRESDTVARIGGDEFAVLAVEASEDSVEVLTNRLQANLEARNTREHRPYKLSLSFGVSRYNPESLCSLEELTSSADARMYEHKRTKQNDREAAKWIAK
jgi:diguanylate cyclase (GGDEF)-like protein